MYTDLTKISVTHDTSIQEALGQMEQLVAFIEKKQAIAATYDRAFGDSQDITVMPSQPDTQPVHWLYTILLPEGTALQDRKDVISDLNANGIGARPLWHLIHGLAPYLNCQAFKIEHSDRLYERGISLPNSVGLSDSEQERAVVVLKDALETLAAKPQRAAS